MKRPGNMPGLFMMRRAQYFATTGAARLGVKL